MKLPRGITGYFDDHDSFNGMDLKKFRAICYKVSENPQLTLISISEADYPTNYICAKFSFKEQPIQILLNAYYPIFTASVIAEHGHIVFCDLPEELNLFSEHYQLLEQKDLQKLLTEECTEQLSEVERHQIELWSPHSIGEVVFNAWD